MVDMQDIMTKFVANIRGGLIGLLSAALILILLWFVAFMVAFGTPGRFADVYLAVVGFLFSGIAPFVILAAGYGIGAFCIRR